MSKKNIKNYFDLLKNHVSTRGNKTAIYYREEQITYSQLEENINRFVSILKKLGVTPGERIVIALPDCTHLF